MDTTNLQQCAFPINALKIMLRSFSALKAFSFSYHPLQIFDGQLPALGLSISLQARRATTPETLKIDFQDGKHDALKFADQPLIAGTMVGDLLQKS